MLNGVVLEAGGGVYRVRLEDGGTVEATLRGRLKREQRTGDRLVVGDRVEVASGPDGAVTIEAVAPRVREIVRRGVGGRRPKLVAANVDRMIVVVAARDPEPATERIDRLLVIAEHNGLDAVVVVNKADLDTEGRAEALDALYRGVGYPVLTASVRTGEGLDELERVLCSGTSALVGPSGAGKSSLLNALRPGLRLRTGEVSAKLRRGRHTTVGARLLPLDCGGFVVDTPGFSDVGVWGAAPEELDACFPEMRPRLALCRFQDCAHVVEPECAVRDAVAEGEVPSSRYRSYVTLLEEARESRRLG